MTAFMTATYSGQLNVVEYLLDVGANPCAPDRVSYHCCCR
jgi:hypothetical protein